MKIDVTKQILDLDGNPVKLEDKILTLKVVAVNALFSLFPNENPSGEEKAQAFSLAMRIHDAKDVVQLKTE
jgi:hypothetical protein